jgi:uncharacterized protein YggE
MKKAIVFRTAILVGTLILFSLFALKPQIPVKAVDAPAADNCATTRTVQVSGTGVVYVTPDRVLIELGVQSTGATPDATQVANFSAVQKVTGAVRAVGVDPKDIAAAGYLVYPVYDNSNSLEINGYRIDNTVSITLKDINRVDDVMIAALKAGANEVQDIQFYTSELRKYRDQARGMAMKASGEKAQALAVDGGAQAGCLINASENTWSTYYGSYNGARSSAIWAQNVSQNANVQAASQLSDDAVFSLGQIAIQAQVSATYSLR